MANQVLVTGASRGIGEQTALALAHALSEVEGEGPIDYGFEPANVAITYLGKQDRAAKVAKAIEDAGQEALVLQMDITDPVSVVEASYTLGQWAPYLNAAVFNVAGGLEGEGNDPVFSEDINNYGQVMLLGALKDQLADDAVVAYIQSHWGHWAGLVAPPPFEGYETYVAQPKRRGEEALRERVARLGEKGVKFTVVTGGIVEDTPVGRRGIRNFPEWSASQRAIGNVIKARDMGLAIARAVTNPRVRPLITVGADKDTFLRHDHLNSFNWEQE